MVDLVITLKDICIHITVLGAQVTPFTLLRVKGHNSYFLLVYIIKLILLLLQFLSIIALYSWIFSYFIWQEFSRFPKFHCFRKPPRNMYQRWTNSPKLCSKAVICMKGLVRGWGEEKVACVCLGKTYQCDNMCNIQSNIILYTWNILYYTEP